MKNGVNIKVIVADDERPARAFLISLLRAIEEVEVIGEAKNGTEAIDLIRDLKPDVAFLDLQMPEISGIEVVRQLRPRELPLVVFVTAFDEYAVQAFDVNAVDYLLKPVERARLIATVARLRERLETEVSQGETSRLYSAVDVYDETSARGFLTRIPVKDGDQITLVPVSEVASIVAEGELLHIKTVSGVRHLINFRLKDIEAKLDPAAFVRLSRGSIVSVACIDKMHPIPGGTYQVVLKTGDEFSASRLQSRALRETLLKL